jgi:hypothetical protein
MDEREHLSLHTLAHQDVKVACTKQQVHTPSSAKKHAGLRLVVAAVMQRSRWPQPKLTVAILQWIHVPTQSTLQMLCIAGFVSFCALTSQNMPPG